MKTAKIIQREITDKNLGVTYILLEMLSGKVLKLENNIRLV